VNLSSGLAHPLDWDKAVLTFRLLKAQGFSWNPRDIEVWAIANGWDAGDTRDLVDVANAYVTGKSKRLKANSHAYKAGLVKLWREIGEEPNWNAH
jgi:hypothetical protein